MYHRIILFITCFACFSLLAHVHGDTTYKVPKVGGSTGGFNYYTAFLPFIDCIKSAKPFSTFEVPYDEKATLDSDGWPIGKSGLMLFSGLTEGTANGTYYFEFYGQAVVSTTGSQVLNQTYNNQTGLTFGYFKVLLSSSSQVMMKFNTPSNNTTIKYLKVIRPGYTVQDSIDQVYTTPALEYLKKFNTIRFMDWLRTNGNLLSNWSDRSKYTDPMWSTDKGVPYEVILLLASKIKRSVWINVPVRADNDYFFQLATLIKSYNLQAIDSSIHVYLEYSNEVWNPMFEAFHYNLKAAIKEVNESKITFPLAYDGSKDIYQWCFRRTALKAKNISDAFATVFGDEERNNFFRVVFATQIANSYVYTQGLDMIVKCYGDPSKYFYALAGAPYFGMKDSQTNLTTIQVLDALNSGIDSVQGYITPLVTRARYYNLKAMAYEGGPDTFGPNNIDAKRNATYHEGMKDIVIKYLKNWFSGGGDEFMWFFVTPGTYKTQYGTWGLSETMLSTTPKAEGVFSVMSMKSIGYNSSIFNTIPAVLPTSKQTTNPYVNPNVLYQNAKMYFNLLVTKPGIYELSLSTIITADKKSNLTIGFYINNAKLGYVNARSFNKTVPGITDSIRVEILSGHRVFVIEAEVGYSYTIQSVNFTLIEAYPESNCPTNYFGDDCSLTSCFNIVSNNSTFVCSGRGDCSDYNSCTCKANYFGTKCQLTTCYGSQSNDPSACSGNGICMDYNSCTCNIGHYGSNCESRVISESSEVSRAPSIIITMNSTSFRANFSDRLTISSLLLLFLSLLFCFVSLG